MIQLQYFILAPLLFFADIQLSNRGFDVLVSSRNTGTVVRFDAETGLFKNEFGKDQIKSETQDLAIGPDGMLYVTSLPNRRVLRFDPQTGVFLDYFTSGYELNGPTKMAFGPDGFLYVSQWGNEQSKVVRFDSHTGKFDREITGNLKGPLGLAWDIKGFLYVACFYGKIIRKFDSEGSVIANVEAPHIKGPSNIWFDTKDDLFVADWESGTISKFTINDGEDVQHEILSEDFAKVEGTVIGPDGFLYACDWFRNLVRKIDLKTGEDLGVYLDQRLLRPNALLFLEIQ